MESEEMMSAKRNIVMIDQGSNLGGEDPNYSHGKRRYFPEDDFLDEDIDLGTECGQVEIENDDVERFRDSDYEMDDDIDLVDLALSREYQWDELVSELGKDVNVRSLEKIGDDEGSDSGWEEPGDDVLDEELYSHSSSESDEEMRGKEKVRLRRMYVKVNFNEDVVFEVGHEFVKRADFQFACKHHGVMTHRRIRFRRSSSKRCTAYCLTSGKFCSWTASVNYRKITKSWEITKLQLKHSCTPTFNHGCCNYRYLGEKYKAEIKIFPNMRISELVQKVQHDLKIKISRATAFKAKQIALKEIVGDYKKQYMMLRDYCNELLRANPNSTVVLQTINDDVGNELFRRLYVCFDACKRGFVEGCRPVIGIDGCHLTGPHKGILLAAIGIDANDQIYPVAYAVVEIENKSSWFWFLTHLQQDLQIKNSKAWTLISDKQKGITSAMKALIPNVEHRLCTWHMYKNFKGASYTSLELKEMVWVAAKCTHENQFNAQMDRIRNTDPSAHAWLEENTAFPEWSRAFFETYSKCDILVNNIVECFNRVVLHARDKPILTMLEALRFYFMDRLQKKRVYIEQLKGQFAPKVRRKLEKNMADSNRCFATCSGELEFQVNCGFLGQCVVNLKTRTCTCKNWDLTGIPCSHAIAAISFVKEEPEVFMHECYSKEAYKRAYKYIIHPINGPQFWDKTDPHRLLPPNDIRLGGRPPKSRKKGADEKKGKPKNKKKNDVKRLSRVGKMSKYTCGICGQSGHNQRRCPTKASSTSQPSASSSQPPNSTSQPPESASQAIHVNAPTPPTRKVKEKKVRNCSICGQLGHYKTTCTSPLAACYHPIIDYVETRGDQ